MTPVRSLLRSTLFLALLVATCIDGQIRKRLFGLRPGPAGAVWVHRWCRRIVRMMGMAVTVDGPLPIVSGHGLAVVSNHLSYLDILIYSATTPFVMVAKSEIRGWPLLGWITAQAGTVYVQRADVKGGQTQTHAQVNAAMREAYRSGLPVLFFPEGTTTDASEVLPFRRGLYHSILAGDIPMNTAALAYTLDEPDPGSTVANDVCFWGDMLFAPHLFRCLGLRGLRANIRFDTTRVAGEDRFALAINSRQHVVELYEGLLKKQYAEQPLFSTAETEHTATA